MYSARMCSSWLLVVMLVACQKDWTGRELKPIEVNLAGQKVHISVPDGVKRSGDANELVAMLDPTPNDGPSVIFSKGMEPISATGTKDKAARIETIWKMCSSVQ